jgi:D-aminoacyl-tRNA deacylase
MRAYLKRMLTEIGKELAMKIVIQRVSRAQVSESQSPHLVQTSIGKGLVLLAGFEESDSPLQIEQMAQKIKSLRIFADSTGKMNLAGTEVGAQYLVTSQFTLYADCKYGNRPSFDKAAPKVRAKEYFGHFVQTMVRILGTEAVHHTPFGSDLQIELVNDGPITLTLDSKDVL